MSLVIISKDNKDHEHIKPKKYYIILEQKERMYLCEAGFFVPHKNMAITINNTAVAKVALDKINALRKTQRAKVLCTVVHEHE